VNRSGRRNVALFIEKNMPIADIINASFEFFASFFVFKHCLVTMKDKRVAGLSITSIIFFTSWGYWNLYYYPSLGQVWSFWAGILVVITNSVWVYLLVRYANQDQLPSFLHGINKRLKKRDEKDHERG